MKTFRAADEVVRQLRDAGVTHLFSVSGNQIMPVYDACIDSEMAIVHTRHEAAAVYMADAWAQVTGRVGVALLTAGPGLANGLAALYAAKLAESPLLLLSGDSPCAQDGSGAFQELDQVALTTPLTKWSVRPTSPPELTETLPRAIETALAGRPGPVHVALPADLLDAAMPAGTPAPREDVPDKADATGQQLAARIAGLMGASKRPLILTGPALSPSRAGNLHKDLRQALGAPVITLESPRGLNDPNLGNLKRVMAEADLVLSLGKPLDFTIDFGNTRSFDPACRFLVADDDPEQVDRAARLVGERAALKETACVKSLAAILSETTPASEEHRAEWLLTVDRHIAHRSPIPEINSADEFVPIGALFTALNESLSEAHEAILVCDGGEFGQWAQAHLSAPVRIINGLSGAIGGGTCYALASKLARPDALVLALMGDGTAGFHLSEFETARRLNLPFIVIIGHDARWNAEVQIQKRRYGDDRLIGCELLPARYDLAVQALGGHGEWVERSGDLKDAIRRAIDSQLPACICVPIEGLPAPNVESH